MPLLDPKHPWVLHELLHTVVHEVGHTLGLRHNFIASEDGHTSVMAYEDPVDTTYLDPLITSSAKLLQPRRTSAALVASDDDDEVRFGAHSSTEPGLYDIYAIKYGYTRLPGESRLSRHAGLDLLANGQDAFDPAGVSDKPQNPLFMTDENLWGNRVDPRINVFFTGIRRMGRDKMAFAQKQRPKLLQRVRNGRIIPNFYSRTIIGNLVAVYRTMSSALDFIGGTQIDASRSKLHHGSPSDTTALLKAITDFICGDCFRFSAEESQFLVVHGSGLFVHFA